MRTLTTLFTLTALCLAPSGAVAGESKAETKSSASDDEVEGDPSAATEAKSKSKSSKKSKTKTKTKSKTKTRNDELCDFRTPIHWHVIEPGEHLGLIAGQYGILSADLIATNPALADNPDHIRAGQKLAVCPELPPRETVIETHEVAAGETFNAIAYAHELSPDELLAMQDGKLRDPDKLRVGDELRIVTVGDILIGFEPDEPARGKLVHSRKLPEHEAYTIKRPHLAYGTPRTIKLIGKVVERYQRRVPGGPKLRMGDISKSSGGPLTGHLSHQEGRDIDIGLVLEGKLANRLHFSGATPENIDLRRTWTLIEEFIATGEVKVIFLDHKVQELLYEWCKANGVPQKKLDEYFQYPRGPHRGHGIVRHWDGHRNHIHVRFRR